jgi:hypothetical protein
MSSKLADRCSEPTRNIFISFARVRNQPTNANLLFAKKLYECFKKKQLSPWMDKDLNNLSDSPWKDEIFRAIQNSAAFVFILTKESIKSGCFAREEYDKALELQVPIQVIFYDRSKEILSIFQEMENDIKYLYRKPKFAEKIKYLRSLVSTQTTVLQGSNQTPLDPNSLQSSSRSPEELEQEISKINQEIKDEICKLDRPSYKRLVDFEGQNKFDNMLDIVIENSQIVNHFRNRILNAINLSPKKVEFSDYSERREEETQDYSLEHVLRSCDDIPVNAENQPIDKFQITQLTIQDLNSSVSDNFNFFVKFLKKKLDFDEYPQSLRREANIWMSNNKPVDLLLSADELEEFYDLQRNERNPYSSNMTIQEIQKEFVTASQKQISSLVAKEFNESPSASEETNPRINLARILLNVGLPTVGLAAASILVAWKFPPSITVSNTSPVTYSSKPESNPLSQTVILSPSTQIGDIPQVNYAGPTFTLPTSSLFDGTKLNDRLDKLAFGLAQEQKERQRLEEVVHRSEAMSFRYSTASRRSDSYK